MRFTGKPGTFMRESGDIFRNIRAKAAKAVSFFTDFLKWELQWQVPIPPPVGQNPIEMAWRMALPQLAFKCQPIKGCIWGCAKAEKS